MGRDSNPRYGSPYSSFQDYRLSPLGHPSIKTRGVTVCPAPPFVIACHAKVKGGRDASFSEDTRRRSEMPGDSRLSLRACEKIVGQSPDTPWPVLRSDHGVFGDCFTLRGCKKISRWALSQCHRLWVPRSDRGRPARNGLRRTRGRDARGPRTILRLWLQSRWR